MADLISKSVVGSSGEYFVAAELSRRGIVATLTLKNTPYIDLLATNLNNVKTANIQVKTMSIDNKSGWRLGIKDEAQSNIANHYYVLVNLLDMTTIPEYIIIPKNVLADYVYKQHRDWLSFSKRDGSPRKDTDIRAFDPYINKKTHEFAEEYINNWEILDLW